MSSMDSRTGQSNRSDPTQSVAAALAWSRADWLILLAVTLIGAALRLYRLGEVPPGFQFDEAFNAIDAQQVLQGNVPLFLPANGGREVLYTYWQAALGALLGINIYTLRLASAIAGLLTIPATYLLLRGLIRRNSRYVAAFTALVLAINFWHIQFSRFGIRVIMMPLLLSATFGLFWLGGHAGTRRRRLLAYMVAGLLVGLTPWTHPTGRFVPFVLIFYVGWLLWRKPALRVWRLDSLVGGLLVTGGMAFLVFLPLGLEFVRHPEFFFGHASEVSVFADRVSGGDPVGHLLDNVLHVVGMFSFYGDMEWTHNLVGRPVFDWFLALPFYLGVLLWIGRLRRNDDPDFDALSLLAFWALVMLLPSLLSEAAPNYSRTLPSLPATFVAAGLGLTWLATYRRPVTWLAPAAVGVILLVSAALTSYDYFVVFANRPEPYYLYDANKLDALEHLAQFTDENQVYISQLWGEKHSTGLFLRGELGIESIDTSDTVVLPPPGKGLVYGFPTEQHERAEQLAALWETATMDEVMDPYGAPLITVVHVPEAAAQAWPTARQPTTETEAHFFEAPTLLGLQTVPDQEELALFWRADQPTFRDLTTFIHLLDQAGRRVGQVDKLPGNGSFRTPYWTPGTRVIEQYVPAILDPCVGGEEVRVVVGWYQYLADNARMARTDSSGDTALAGTLTLPLKSYPSARMAPATALNAALSPAMTLVGYTLHSDELQPGSPLTVDLYFSGAADALILGVTGEPASAAMIPLWEGAPALDADWDADEILCRRLHLTVPATLEPGPYTLQAATGDGNVDVAAIQVAPSTRQFQLPPVDVTIGARFADEIQLAGATITPGGDSVPGDAAPGDVAPGNEVTVTLVWQALTSPTDGYKAFVHLLDDTGQIVVQSDAEPGGSTTTGWVTGEVVVDTHTLILPDDILADDTLPGTLHVVAGLYEQIDGRRLAAQDEAGEGYPADAVPVGTLDVVGANSP